MGKRKYGKKIQVECHFCERKIDPPVREHKITKSDFYVCHVCNKSRTKIDSLEEEGKFLVSKFNAAGAWTGYDLITPTKEDLAAKDRARSILLRGISELGLN